MIIRSGEDLPKVITDFTSKCSQRFAPAANKVNYIKLRFACKSDPHRFTSDQDLSTIQWWFDSKMVECRPTTKAKEAVEVTPKCYKECIQKAPTSVAVGEFLMMTSAMSETDHLDKAISAALNTVADLQGRPHPEAKGKFATSSFVKHDSKQGTFRWPNTPQRTYRYECATEDAEFVAPLLNKLFNKATSVFTRPGLHDIRFLAVDRFRSNSATINANFTAHMAQKHKNFIACHGECIYVTHIMDLYKEIIHDGKPMDLKTFCLSLTFPLVPPTDGRGNQVCVDANGNILLDRNGQPRAPERLVTDCCRNFLRGSSTSHEHIYMVPKNRYELGKTVIDNLPAFVNLYFGYLPEGWFFETAEAIVNRITFIKDPETQLWTGEWTSEADEEAQALIMEDMGMGMTMIIEDLHLVDNYQAPQMPLLRPGDNMSTGTGKSDFDLGDRPALPDDDDSTIASTDSTPTQQQAGSEPPAADGGAGHSVTGASVN